MMPVRSTEDVLELMKVGQRNRAVGATALNERSSRSHRLVFPAVVMFYIFLVGLSI
jgi:kinesin family protein C2/C3